VVFVDGCFWHGCRKCGHIPRTNSRFWGAKITGNRARDRRMDRRLRRLGLRVVRFWEHDLQLNLGECLRAVCSAAISDARVDRQWGRP